jgi:hypothetical protein
VVSYYSKNRETRNSRIASNCSKNIGIIENVLVSRTLATAGTPDTARMPTAAWTLATEETLNMF